MKNAFNVIVYGGLGDLAKKKIIPSLFNGYLNKSISADSDIFLITKQLADTNYTQTIKNALETSHPNVSESSIVDFCNMLHIVEMMISDQADDWQELKSSLDNSPTKKAIHFLAVPPKLFITICKMLATLDLNHDQSNIILEKPLGHDLSSALEINEQVLTYFNEDHIYRIDHYLGKASVQNLLTLRYSNLLFEHIWNKDAIDNVQISISEDIGVEGRGAFYDDTGALKDMVQNHLLQLLCLIAMEPPSILNQEEIRAEKVKVLKALEPFSDETIKQRTVRGQYNQGSDTIGCTLPSYLADAEVEKSHTETFVAIKAHVNNWRWSGVPFYLKTGKRLESKFAEIVVQFKDVPHVSNQAWKKSISPNRFIIRLQPQDRLILKIMTSKFGLDEHSLNEVGLSLNDTERQKHDSYLRLILAAAENDQSLFVHADEIKHTWKWIDQILASWDKTNAPLHHYEAGSTGPQAADDLLAQDGRSWYQDIENAQ